MKQGLNEACARYLILAQVASDGGKKIRTIRKIIPGSEKAWKRGYDAKNEYISKFISIVLKAGPICGFRFYVTDGSITPYIIYIWFRLNGQKRQISFHSYDSSLSKYMKNRKNKTHWNGIYSGSRDACIDLANAIFNE